MPANKRSWIAKNVTKPAASSKAKKKAKATPKPVPKKSRKSHRSLDTYEIWLETQQKKRRIEVREVKASVMPADTMSEWLRKQPVVERQQRAGVTPTSDSMEDWLRRQVAERVDKERLYEQETHAAARVEESAQPQEEQQQEVHTSEPKV